MPTFHELTDALAERYGEDARHVDAKHWVYEVMTHDQRSQVVHLLYKEQDIEGRDASRVIVDSPIGPLPQRFDLEQLLRKNAELDVGAVCIEDFRNEDNELVTYLSLRASHLLPTLDFEEICEMLEKIAFVADDLEQDIYARDIH